MKPKISLKKLLSVLKDENLLSYKSCGIDTLDDSSECFLFFHSHDVDTFLSEPSEKIPAFAYVARVGRKFDGHSCARKILLSKNVFIGDFDKTSANCADRDLLEKSFFIGVTDPESALKSLLKESFKINMSDFQFIGVTGTNGKTSVVQITGQILEDRFSEHVLKIGTLGLEIGSQKIPTSHVTTPDFPALISILHEAKKSDVKKVIMEVTSHGLKEKRLDDLKMDIAVFTNLTQDHIDFHGTMDDYRESKKRLFSKNFSEQGTAIIDINNSEWPVFLEAAQGKNRTLITAGCEDSEKEAFKRYISKFKSVKHLVLSSSGKKCDLNGTSGLLLLKDERGETLQKHEFSSPLLGDFQYDNILCATAIGLALGLSLKDICISLNKLKNIPGRLELVKMGEGDPKVVVDYAHSPDALEKSILTCKKMLPQNGKLITVFGCGGDRDRSKRSQMGKIASELSHLVVVTSDNPRGEDPYKIIDDIFSGISDREKCMSESDRKLAIQKAIGLAGKNDLILIAGKGHENYQIIGETKYPFSDEDVVRNLLKGNLN